MLICAYFFTWLCQVLVMAGMIFSCVVRTLSCSEVKVLVTQLCLTLWNPRDCSLPSSSVHGILQARILEWVAISFSRGPSRPRDRTQGSNPGLPHSRQTL